MDAFDCLSKTDSVLDGLPADILFAIKAKFIANLAEEATKIIQLRSRNEFYRCLNEDIIMSGFTYSYLSLCRHTGNSNIPKSYNIVECAVKNKLSELDMFLPIWNQLYFLYISDYHTTMAL